METTAPKLLDIRYTEPKDCPAVPADAIATLKAAWLDYKRDPQNHQPKQTLVIRMRDPDSEYRCSIAGLTSFGHLCFVESYSPFMTPDVNIPGAAVAAMLEGYLAKRERLEKQFLQSVHASSLLPPKSEEAYRLALPGVDLRYTTTDEDPNLCEDLSRGLADRVVGKFVVRGPREDQEKLIAFLALSGSTVELEYKDSGASDSYVTYIS